MRIVVTGTSGGIGSAILEELKGIDAEVVTINRADWKNLGQVLSGTFDIVIFTTGTCPVIPIGALDDATFTETLSTNCGLFVRLVRELVAKRLYNPDGTKIVAVSSVSATEGWAGGAAYCASKGALSAVCRALDAELKGRKISVKAVEPRYIKTKMFDECAGRMGVPASLAELPKDFATKLLKGIITNG